MYLWEHIPGQKQKILQRKRKMNQVISELQVLSNAFHLITTIKNDLAMTQFEYNIEWHLCDM